MQNGDGKIKKKKNSNKKFQQIPQKLEKPKLPSKNLKLAMEKFKKIVNFKITFKNKKQNQKRKPTPTKGKQSIKTSNRR